MMSRPFCPLPAQMEFMNIPHNYDIDIACYQGGKGSGKTCCGAVLGITLCEEFAGINGLAVANTYTILEGSLIPEYKKKLDFFGYRYRKDWTYNETKKELKFNNGSSIKFRYAADPEEGFKGIDAGFVQFDEMSQCPETAFMEALARLRQVELKNGARIPTRRIFGHTNPSSGKDWIYEHFYRHKDYEELIEYSVNGRNRFYKRAYTLTTIKPFDDEDLIVKVPYRLVIASTIQNIHATATYIASMRDKYDAEYFNINVMGEFGDYTKGLVCKSFSDRHNVREFIEIDDTKPLHLTCDFNGDPMSWLVAQRNDKEVYFIDEYSIEDTYTAAVLEKFMKDYPPYKYPYVIINGDASGNFRDAISPETHYSLMYTTLTKAGYSVDICVPAGNTSKMARITAWNGMVKNSRGEHRIFISRKCEKLIWNCENLKFKEGTSEPDTPTVTMIQRDPRLKWVGHVFDAASYMVQYYFPVLAEDEDEDLRKTPMILKPNSRYDVNRYGYNIGRKL